jgi:hypothetical protein
MGPRVSLNMVAKIKIPSLTDIQTPAIQFIDINYTYGTMKNSFCKTFHIFS